MRTRWIGIPTNKPASTIITSQLFAVCLAACKYQHRKWCHSGDAGSPVWTPASWCSRWKLDHYGLHCLCVWLMGSAGASSCCLWHSFSSSQRLQNREHAAQTSVWTIIITGETRWSYLVLLQLLLLQHFRCSDGVWCNINGNYRVRC